MSAATTAAAGPGARRPSSTSCARRATGRVVNTVAVVVLPDAPAPTGQPAEPGGGRRPGRGRLPRRAVRRLRRPGVDVAAARRERRAGGHRHARRHRPAPVRHRRPRASGNLRDVVRDVSGAAALGPAIRPDTRRCAPWRRRWRECPRRRRGRRCAARRQPTAAVAELARRYAAVRAAAVAAAADARAAQPSATATAARRRATLGRMARWGITPLGAEVADPTLGELADRVRRAAEVARAARRRCAGHDGRRHRGRCSPRPSARWSRPKARGRCSPACPPPPSPGCAAEPTAAGSAPRLDPDWLETVAPVRPALARLEAAQLGQRLATGGRPLRAWSNRPGDPWQTVPPPPSDTEVVRPSRLVAAFGPPGVLPGRPAATTPGRVAVAVIDRFAETVPGTEQVSAVAFPHDLPTARAPQADRPRRAAGGRRGADTGRARRHRRRGPRRWRGRGWPTSPTWARRPGSLHLAALPAAGRAGVELGAR